MRRSLGIPYCLAAALALAACSEDPKPEPKPEKPLPVARVTGPSHMHQIGDRVVVSGEESTGEGELEYRWTLIVPEGSEAAFEFENRSKNAFTVDAGGTFTVQLVVVDRNGESEPANFDVQVAYGAPTAVLELIAPDPTVALDDEVIADGSKSVDPAGQPLTYEFRLTQRPLGSQALITAEGSKARFMPDRGGLYEVGLKVRNATTISEEVTRTIVVEPPRNRPPTANAGRDRGQRLGEEVLLDGSLSSDPDGDELSFAWRMLSKPEGSLAEIEDANQMIARFLPDEEGNYEIELEVSDGEFTSTDTVTIRGIATVNLPPQITNVTLDGFRVQSGGTETRPFGNSVVIQAEVFDDQGADLVMHWDLVRPDGSAAELSDQGKLKKGLTADVDGIYQISITANDGELDSDTFSFGIRFRGENRLPVAVLRTIDGLVSYPAGTQITLDGSHSYDTDEPQDKLTNFAWRLLAQPDGQPNQTLNESGSGSSVTFRLQKKSTMSRPYRFELVVSDSMGGVSEPVTLEIESRNRPPVARVVQPNPALLANVHVEKLEPEHPNPGSHVNLNAMTPGHESSDPDPGDEGRLTFLWQVVSQPPGSNPVLNNPTNVSTGFYTDMAGTYQVKLTVSDNDPVEPGIDEETVTVEILE
jgi:hypothetical protein